MKQRFWNSAENFCTPISEKAGYIGKGSVAHALALNCKGFYDFGPRSYP
tara:strand:+ start:5512 stop:5658 length:147 start_codon:yes stop_codon:yes gene_type:complete